MSQTRFPKKRLMKILLVMGLIVGGVFLVIYLPSRLCLVNKTVYEARQGQRHYDFDETISREVLESYLSRAITYAHLLDRSYLEGWVQGSVSDGIRCITNTGAKFIGRVLFAWNGENQLPAKLPEAKKIAEEIHAIDPEIILQACVFETVSVQVETIPIPAWVFEEFGITPEARNFSFTKMYETGGEHDDFWENNTAVPDMSRLETRMWCFFLAKTYIDIGIEAIHFGQVALMSVNDPWLTNWRDMLARVRAYAKEHARRHMVLCDAHVPNGGYVHNCRLMFDFHSFPQRPEEVTNDPYKAQLRVGQTDSIYKRSKGGITPSGWACDSLPYLVEFDNFGMTDTPNENTGGHWIWGYDEITWYAHQSETYRNDYLWYAVRWLEDNDPNGFLQVCGSRSLAEKVNDHQWYFANTACANMPHGYNQEETIKQIWGSMSGFYLSESAGSIVTR